MTDLDVKFSLESKRNNFIYIYIFFKWVSMDEKIQRKHDSDDHSTSNHNIFITFSAQPPLICLNVPWLNSGYIWWWFWIVCLFLWYSTSYLLTRARKLNDNNTFLNFLHVWFCINTTCRYIVLYYFCTINIFLKVCTNMEVCRTALIFFCHILCWKILNISWCKLHILLYI